MLERADRAVLAVLNRDAANSAFDWLMPRLTHLDHYWWFRIAAMAAVAYAVWRWGKVGAIWILCAVVAVGISDLSATDAVKRLVHRPRPCVVIGAQGQLSDPEDRLVGQCPGSPSFPSNHASNMMALGATLWWLTRTRSGSRPLRARRFGWTELWFLVPLVIGYTRCYLGVHYPTDVLGGWILGAIIAALVAQFVARPLLYVRPQTTLEHGQ